MADEGERIGGVYIDVGIDDEGVLARLNAIETAVVKLGKGTTNIKVKVVEEGSTASAAARKKPIELNTTLKLEANAAKKALRGISATLPVNLSLTNDAISKLKAQITEAFQNFSVRVNVEYGGQSGTYSRSAAQDEFAEATGLEGGGRVRSKRVTRSSGPAAAPAPAFDRFYAVVKNTETLETLKQGFKKLQSDPAATQGMANRFTGTMNQLQRRLRVLSATPAGTLAEEQYQPPERPLVERVRRVQKRSALTPKRIIPRPITAAVEAVEESSVEEQRARTYPPLPTSTRTGQRRPMQNANDDPALARIEAQQREQDRASALISGRGAGEPSKFSPRFRSYRAFDRTSLTGRGRRRGPTRTVAPGPDPSRRFLEPFARNPITTVADENALGVLDPAAFAIINSYRRGEFGTTEEPMVERLNLEGRREGELAPLTDPQRRQAVREAGSTAYGTTFSGGRRRIVSPKTIAKERLATLGELSPLVHQRIFGTGVETDPDAIRLGLLNNPKYRPAAGSFGNGGYIGVSTGAGGAARSINDTPEGNAQNRARVQAGLYQDALRRLRAESPDIARAVEELPTPGRRRAFLRPFTEPYADTVEQRALMKASPREFGFDQRRLTGAFQRYQSGFASRAGLEGYLGADQQVTPASTYRSFVSKFLDQYKSEFNYKPNAKLKSLPLAIQALIQGQGAKIRDDVGSTVIDYDKFSATGGAGRRFVPGSIEEAAARIEPAGRATTKARDRRRSYTPEEQREAELDAQIMRLKGQRGMLGIEYERTPESRKRVAAGLGTRVARTGAAGEFQNQVRTLNWAGTSSGYQASFGEPEFAAPASMIAIPQSERRRYSSTALDLAGRGKMGGQIGMTQSLALMDRLVPLLRERAAIAPQAAASRDLERARGVVIGGGPIISEKTPLTGDELRAKLAGSPIVGRAIKPYAPPSIGEAAVLARVQRAAAGPEQEPEHISAGRAAIDAKLAARGIRLKAAEDIAPPLGGGKTALAAGGGVVPVEIVRSIPLEFVGGGGPGVGGRDAKGRFLPGEKAAEAKEPPLGGATVEEAKVVAFQSRARQRATLLRTLQSQGLPIEEAKTEPRPFSGKSPARIEAESEILAARSLSPTRAFQTAIAAAFAKTIGGGAGFERRVKGLQGALSQRADTAEELSDTGRDLAAVRKNLRGVAIVADQLAAAGKPIPKELVQYEESLREDRKQLVERVVAQRGQREEATENVAARRRGLISPVGVVRGFAALGVGAIAGGLIFSAASQAIQGAITLLEQQATKAADSLSGFALTAAKVSGELASAIRASFGDTRGAIAGAAAPTGISGQALATLNGRGLAGRAEAIAASQARVSESDLFRSANFLNSDRLRGGFDRALFQGTGGILNTQLLAPQPGLLERVGDDFSAFRAPRINQNYDPRVQFFSDITGVKKESRLTPPPDTEIAQRTTTYVKDLNEQLGRANSSFRYLTDATDDQKKAMLESAEKLGQTDIAQKLVAAGVAITGQNGRGLTGTEFGQAAADLSRGQLIVDPRVAIQQDRRGIEAQLAGLRRQREHELTFTQPTQRSLENLAAPALPPGTGIIPNANETKAVSQGIAQAAQLQGQLNQRYEQGNQILKDILPADLYQNIEKTGQAIAQIQTSIANQSAALQTHEYNNQLRIAERTLSDIAGLTGKNYGYGKSQIGVLERQNFELSKQSQLLAQELAQRQINFQVAVAGFTVAGQSPEERAARLKDAKTQAEFAQKQLDIQKKQSQNQFKLFDLNNIRAATDAIASIALLREGRSVAINTKVAEEKLQRLNKLQADNLKKAGAYLTEVEGQAAIAMSEIQKLETAYGKAINGITLDTINGFNTYIRQLYSSLSTLYGSGDPNSNNQISAGGGADRHAAGAIFSTMGPTSMIVGEAGTETVAVIRNPRNVTPSGGGGASINININNPVVKEPTDIRKITNAVVQALNTRTALLGLR